MTTEAPQDTQDDTTIAPSTVASDGTALAVVVDDPAARAEATEQFFVEVSHAVAIGESFEPPRTFQEFLVEAAWLDAALESTGGEITPAMEIVLTQFNQALATKAQGVRNYLDGFKREIAEYSAEIARLQQHREAMVQRFDNFKRYVKTAMEHTGQTKIAGALGSKLWVQRNGQPSFEIIDATLIPDEYKHEEVVVHIDTERLKAEAAKSPDLTLYVEVPGIVEGEGDAPDQEVTITKPVARVVPGTHLRFN